MRDADNFGHAQHHRRARETANRTYDRAVLAYVALIRGPRPDLAKSPDETT